MPLSEYEQRVLAQMEQHLRDADPGLEKSLSSRGRIDVKKLSIGVLGTIVGLGVLVAGVATTQVWLGILGFVGMLGGVLYATTHSGGTRAPGTAKAPRSTSGFMDRQQERWEKRRDGHS